MDHSNYISDRRAIVAAVASLGTAPLLLQFFPLFIGALVDELGFSIDQASYVASASVASAGLTAIVCMFVIRRVNWRNSIRLGFATMATGYIVCSFFDSFWPVLLAMCISSVGFALAAQTAVACLSDTEHADRYFALGIMIQFTLTFITLMIIPHVLFHWGLDAVLTGCGLIAIGMLFIAYRVPVGGIDRTEAGRERNSPSIRLWLGMAGITCFFISVSSFWALVERIAVEAGFEPVFIGNVLASTAIGSMIAALVAAVIGERYPRSWLLIAVALIQSSTIWLLVSDMKALEFIVVSLAFTMVWAFVISVQMGVINDADPSGRMVILVGFVQMLGFSIGPALSGWLVVEQGYLAVNIIISIFALASCLLLLPVALMQKHKNLEQSAG